MTTAVYIAQPVGRLLLTSLEGGKDKCTGICTKNEPKIVPKQTLRYRVETETTVEDLQISSNIEPGTVIGAHYEVRQMLGSGGMGVVYKAWHQDLNRFVALKVLHKHYATDDELVQRFLREARATSVLQHKNVVSIFAMGKCDVFGPYMVLEFVDGRTLGGLLEERTRLSVDDAVPIFKQICAALQHAHEAGIVHRDLKPSNVMLVETEHGLLTKVVDFGLATVIPQGQTIQHLTATGSIVGDPHFMSPEQVRGERLDARSDIYSLGCLMYECLTGKTPFEGENSLATMMKRLQEEAPPFPRSLALPDAFEEIVMMALRSAACDRQDSAAEVAQQLDMAIAGTFQKPRKRRRSSAGMPAITGERRRNPLRISIVYGVAALALIWGGCFAVLHLNTSEPAAEEEPPAHAEGLIKHAELILFGKLTQSQVPWVEQLLQDAYKSAKTHGKPKTMAIAADDLATLYAKSDIGRAWPWIDEADRLAERAQEPSLKNHNSELRLNCYLQTGQYKRAEDLLKTVDPNIGNWNSRGSFDAAAAKAECLYRCGHPDEAIKLLESQDWLHRFPAWQDSACLLASLYLKTGNPERTYDVMKRAQSDKKLVGYRKSSILSFGAALFAHAGDLKRARELLDAAQPYADFEYHQYSHARLMLELAESLKSADLSRQTAALEKLFTFYEEGDFLDISRSELQYVQDLYLKACGNDSDKKEQIRARAAKLRRFSGIDAYRSSYIY